MCANIDIDAYIIHKEYYLHCPVSDPGDPYEGRKERGVFEQRSTLHTLPISMWNYNPSPIPDRFSLSTVALSLPNAVTLYYSSSCCSDPPSPKIIFIATS